MKQKNNDLREALRRHEPEEHQLSADFADRLAERLQQSREGTATVCQPSTEKRRQPRWFRKAAAIFLGIVLVSGIALAAVLFSRSSGVQEARSSGNILVQRSPSPIGEGRGEAFTNIRLDSLLGMVAPYYGCTVVYRDEQPRSLRISTTWNQRQSLAAFIELLNELDGLRLTTEGDTIFVSNK